MNVFILGRWVMDASIIEEDARSELLAVMRSSIVVIVTMKPRMLSNPIDQHELVRSDVKQVICAVCDTEQPVARVCTNCGVNMGEYFCEVCKFFDDDIDKRQFHCDDCGICRVGGRENYFHCKKCGSCYAISLRDNHSCVENSMQHHCPICYEYLFDSLKDTIVMKCGHTMHCECYHEMMKLIEATVMPEDYRYKKVWILCNDCNDTTEVFFHIIGQKCSHCKSYNTRTIAPPQYEIADGSHEDRTAPNVCEHTLCAEDGKPMQIHSMNGKNLQNIV
ncbi:unnamed protein product [Camellia sinensis]